jgi:hypothetical protein
MERGCGMSGAKKQLRWGIREEVITVVLEVCAEGCYKHYDKATGRWVCCKCGE